MPEGYELKNNNGVLTWWSSKYGWGPPAGNEPSGLRPFDTVAAATEANKPKNTPSSAGSDAQTLLDSFKESISAMKVGFAEQMQSIRGSYDSQIAKMKRDQDMLRRRRQKEATFRALRSTRDSKVSAGVAGGGAGVGGGGTILTSGANSRLGGQAGKTLLGI